MLMETKIINRKLTEVFEVELVSGPLVPDESMEGYLFRPTFARVTTTVRNGITSSEARIMGFRVNPTTRQAVGHLRGMAPHPELERQVIALTQLESIPGVLA